MNKRIKGCLLVAASAVLFGFYPIVAKYAYAGGANAVTMLLLKGVGLLPLGLWGFLDKRVNMRVAPGKELRDVSISAVVGATCTPLLLLSSYAFISAGTATTLHYLYCVLTVVLCVFFYHDPFDKRKGLCVALCMGGVALLFAPKETGGALGVALALGSAFTYAFYAVFLEKSGLHAMPPVKLQFYSLVVSTAAAAVYGLISGNLVFDLTPGVWAVALGYYGVGSILASVFFQKGVHLIGSQGAAILSTLEPLTSVLLGIFLFQEALTLRSAIGIAVILAAAVLITCMDGADEKKRAGKAEEASAEPYTNSQH